MATAVVERLSGTTFEDGHRPWLTVCSLDELEPLWGEAALLRGTQIALVRLPDDRVFAVDHWDPRAQANVMARGIVGSAKGRATLASPIYKQVYDLESGECLSETGAALNVYPVRVVGGAVQVSL